MPSVKNAHKPSSSDRRTSGERRQAEDKRRAHDRFTPGQGAKERRRNERRIGRN